MAQLRPVDLEGSVALVTGGTGQVGAAVADLLGSAGAEVAVADEPGPELQRMEIRLGLAAFECGFSDPTELVTVFGAVEERFGRLDLLVCSHGSPPPSRPLLEIPFEEYRRTLAVNLDSTFLAVQQAGRAMIAGGRGGRIVIVGSTDGAAGGADFEASQAALPGLVRGASEGLAEHDVTVNAILHGPLRPEPADDEYVDPAERPRDAGGPLGEAADVARAALWLIDPDNSYVTGSVVTVDGGRSS
ncbi:MAG TPA: SDR family oxidoreductase [Solirubrobacterales bacterium]|jgi:NAD(P)-dependent dehydrogenase (short-subunit alcohol dehydrogenase family)|nr:SDR family oxidoreductase [Solirubrobacterales bacterium]